MELLCCEGKETKTCIKVTRKTKTIHYMNRVSVQLAQRLLLIILCFLKTIDLHGSKRNETEQ